MRKCAAGFLAAFAVQVREVLPVGPGIRDKIYGRRATRTACETSEGKTVGESSGGCLSNLENVLP